MFEPELDLSFYSCVVKLAVQHTVTLPKTHGNYAEAAFLSIINATAPDLAQALHDMGSRKPFTVSPLHGLPASADGCIYAQAGREVWLRLTLLGQPVFAAFINRFLLGEARPTLRIGAGRFAVSEVLTTPGAHAWAGYTSADELLAQARAEDTLMLEFATPFSFSLGDKRIDIMPRPELVFDGLQRKWQQWCGFLPLPAVLERDWLREYVLVSEWRMQSRMLRYGRRPEIGSTGTVMFKVFEADADRCRALNALADFAFYAGVGRKTAQGMGQVRRLDRWIPGQPLEVDEATADDW